MAERRALGLRAPIRIVVIAAAGLLLAGASMLAAIDRVQERVAGAEPVAGAMTPGFALSHRATALIAAHAQTRGDASWFVPDDIAAQVRALSLAALQREPMDGAALRNLALLAAGAGEDGEARDLLLLAERLSRRDARTNLLLAQGFAREGDLPATVQRIDQALRSSTAARREVLPLLYQMLQQPGAEIVLADLLAGEVNWEGAFWADAASHRPALAQLAALRIARAEAGFVSSLRDDRHLLDALVAERQFAPAQALSEVLHGAPHDQRGALHDQSGALRNGDFAHAPKIGAFDWDLRFDSGMSSDILTGPGQLRVQTFGGGGGLAARQLVALEQQLYRLDLQASEWDRRDAEALSIRLSCAERVGEGGVEDLRIAIPAARTSANFVKPDAGCIYHWLDIVVAAQADRRENELLVDFVALIPLEGA